MIDDEEQPGQLADIRERMLVKAVKAPDGDLRDRDAIAAWADEIARALEEAAGP